MATSKKVRSPPLRSFLDLVNLTPLMLITRGSPEVRIGLIDGAVDVKHRGFGSPTGIKQVLPKSTIGSLDLAHGTFVAGILVSRSGLDAPGICPDCRMLVCPVLRDNFPVTGQDVAHAMVDLVDEGVCIINISASMFESSASERAALEEALDYVRARRVLIIAAAGNEGRAVESPLISHPWVLCVSASAVDGRPSNSSNTALTLGRYGLSAPGEDIPGLAPGGGTTIGGGTSAAAPFVTGAAALLWSCFPTASSQNVRRALLWAGGASRRGIVPPLLDAHSAYRLLESSDPELVWRAWTPQRAIAGSLRRVENAASR